MLFLYLNKYFPFRAKPSLHLFFMNDGRYTEKLVQLLHT